MRLTRLMGLALLSAVPAIGLAEEASGRAQVGASEISINSIGGLPSLLGDDVRLQWIVPGDPAATRALRELHYDAVDETVGADIHRTLISSELIDGRNLTHNYIFVPPGSASGRYTVHIDLDLPSGATVELSGDPGFIPEPLPGFGAVYGKVLAIVVDGQGQQKLESPAPGFTERTLDPADWFGIRNRFWTGLLRSESSSLNIRVDTRQENLPRLIAIPPENAARLKLELYAGPVESNNLATVDPRLTGMLFAALWDWLRMLCFGMSWLLTGVHALIGNVGLAIILLSVCVKILMSPLTLIADRWQDSVNKTLAILQPKIDAIKRDYKGEDAHNRVLGVYREHDIHPMYAVKSLAGFLIQIPIFIAAFDLLGESFLLNGTSFLWAEDLAKPDRLLSLPWDLPFFGSYLNLFPFLMTGVTLLTSWIQTDPSLTPELLHKQRLRLYLMAVAFFLLFYTFPAGMVLYWMTNNVLHLLKIQVGRWKKVTR
jgi:YidC/Oxa1 family membrane protein insertase